MIIYKICRIINNNMWSCQKYNIYPCMILKSDFYTCAFKVVLGHIRNIYDLLFKYHLSDHFIYNQNSCNVYIVK